MHHLPATLRRWLSRAQKPVGDRANAELAHQLLQELEDQQQPSPLLLNIATGFPSALLCVLAAGVLAGALAGREVSTPLSTRAAEERLASAPLAPAGVTPAGLALAGAALAGRQAQLQALEVQALLGAPQRDMPPPAGETRQR